MIIGVELARFYLSAIAHSTLATTSLSR